MNEERIKERCKREDIALKVVKGFLEKDCYMDTELEYSLNTLLDLYNKQQKEIKALELIHETYKEEIKSIEDRYISKDKIREVLEKERKKQKERTDISLALHSQYISLIDKIKKQILEEK